MRRHSTLLGSFIGWVLTVAIASPAPGQETEVQGAPTPEEAVEVFLRAAAEAGRHERGSEPYNSELYTMALVFGTDDGSILNRMPAEEVYNRMVVLRACLRPDEFTITSQPDPDAREKKETIVSVEVVRDIGRRILPFTVVQGPEDRWYISRIDVSHFEC